MTASSIQIIPYFFFKYLIVVEKMCTVKSNTKKQHVFLMIFNYIQLSNDFLIVRYTWKNRINSIQEKRYCAVKWQMNHFYYNKINASIHLRTSRMKCFTNYCNKNKKTEQNENSIWEYNRHNSVE